MPPKKKESSGGETLTRIAIVSGDRRVRGDRDTAATGGWRLAAAVAGCNLSLSHLQIRFCRNGRL